MKILITGAAGFIGQALAKQLENSEHEVHLTDIHEPKNIYGHRFQQLDISDKFGSWLLPDVDIVYHLCAYNNTAHFYTKPLSVINSTLTPTINLIQRYRDLNTKFVYASSSEIYAGGVQLGITDIPTPEVNIGIINEIDNTRWSYAGSKLMGEIAVHAAHKEHGLEYVIIRYHNAYGKEQKNHFIPEYADRLREGDNVLYGHDETRAFIYIDDAAELTLIVGEKLNNDTIHIGNPIETSIGDVAEIIRDILKVEVEPTYKNAPTGSVSRRCADVTKLMSLVGDYEFTSLKDGLIKTLD
jgi:nucleoside-diphosphate-sugar epimerase